MEARVHWSSFPQLADSLKPPYLWRFYQGLLLSYSPSLGPVLPTETEGKALQIEQSGKKEINFTCGILGQWWIATASEIHMNWRQTSSGPCWATQHTTVFYQSSLHTPFPPWCSWPHPTTYLLEQHAEVARVSPIHRSEPNLPMSNCWFLWARN